MSSVLPSMSNLIQQREAAQGGSISRDKDTVPKIETRALNFFYGERQALFDINVAIPQTSVTALIGPSGCGKSTFLRTLNRMNDIVEGSRLQGNVLLDGADIYDSSVDVVALRKRVGMVFQKSNPFPKSIFDNVAFGPRIAGTALDPASTARIEDLIFELKQNYTIVIVTHNMQQAARVSEWTAFFYQGKLVEMGLTDQLFTKPREKDTEDYITGRFG